MQATGSRIPPAPNKVKSGPAKELYRYPARSVLTEGLRGHSLNIGFFGAVRERLNTDFFEGKNLPRKGVVPLSGPAGIDKGIEGSFPEYRILERCESG
jgi:hypothetical protein